MNAYKFLRTGTVGPFSEFQWPAPADGRPGPWIDAGGPPDLCRRGVHGCRIEDLPWWLSTELWEVELAGDVVSYPHKVAAPRGRLLKRVVTWDDAMRRAFGEACAWRARHHGVGALLGSGETTAAERLAACTALTDVVDLTRELAGTDGEARVPLAMVADGANAARAGSAATSAYVAAHVAGRTGGADAMDAERRWQSDWLRERLALR